MFILGLISFFQVVFIPGFIFLKLVKFDMTQRIRALVYSFALSLLINYLVVFMLTAIGIYTPTAIYSLIVLEILLIAYIFIKKEPAPAVKKTCTTCRTGSYSLSYLLLLILAIAMLLVYFVLFLAKSGSVFKYLDAVFGWNRFALDWCANRFPTMTWNYPQVIPTNWSLTYVIMQNSNLQFFARSLMGLFPIATILLFLDLGLKKRQPLYFSALIIYGGILGYFYFPDFISAGYVDIAVAFFGFLSFYTLHSCEKDLPEQKDILFAVIFASTGAVVKQAGLFILFIILVWIAVKLFTRKQDLTSAKLKKIIISMVLPVLLITCSWYIFKQVQIAKGLDRSEVAYVTQNVHSDRTYIERFAHGLKYIIDIRPGYPVQLFLYIAAVLLLVALADKRSRYVTLFIVLPYTILWGFFYSYSHRNLTLVFPFMGYSLAAGTAYFQDKAGKIREKLPAAALRGKYVAVFLVIFAITLHFTAFDKEEIVAEQIKQQKKIGNPQLNALLYKYKRQNDLKGKIYSDYPYFQVLPELKKYRTSDRKDPALSYFLFDTQKAGDQWKEVKQKINAGQYTMLFACGRYRFLKINYRK